MSDIFDRTHTYKYLAPGAIWFNGTFFDSPDQPWRPRARIWVPDDFPACESHEGRMFAGLSGEPLSPRGLRALEHRAGSAVAEVPAVGGGPATSTTPVSPLPADYWLTHSGDTGPDRPFQGEGRQDPSQSLKDLRARKDPDGFREWEVPPGSTLMAVGPAKRGQRRHAVIHFRLRERHALVFDALRSTGAVFRGQALHAHILRFRRTRPTRCRGPRRAGT